MNSYLCGGVALVLTCATLHGAPVVNWVIDDTAPPAGQTLVTSGLNTDSPVIGTTDPALPDNADACDFHSDFPQITLSNGGDAIVLTGDVTLTGINSS